MAKQANLQIKSYLFDEDNMKAVNDKRLNSWSKTNVDRFQAMAMLQCVLGQLSTECLCAIQEMKPHKSNYDKLLSLSIALNQQTSFSLVNGLAESNERKNFVEDFLFAISSDKEQGDLAFLLYDNTNNVPFVIKQSQNACELIQVSLAGSVLQISKSTGAKQHLEDNDCVVVMTKLQK